MSGALVGEMACLAALKTSAKGHKTFSFRVVKLRKGFLSIGLDIVNRCRGIIRTTLRRVPVMRRVWTRVSSRVFCEADVVNA